MADHFDTNQQILTAARRTLQQNAWDYLVGGSESETTVRRNRLAFDHYGFRPRILVDVSKPDPSTTFLGHRLRIPVLLAPVGSLELLHPDGVFASAKAAAEFGTLEVAGASNLTQIKAVADASNGPKVFQVYVDGDTAWTRGVLRRIKAAGYVAVCVTADTAAYGIAERRLLNGYVSPSRQRRRDPDYRAALTWETLDAIRDACDGLPLILKGVATAEDAALAIEHGVDVVWVSNHGGRQIDHARGSLDTLPEVVKAVAGRAEIVLDGGVLRGSDVLKAIGLGAKAVAIGKLQGWGLAANGADGVRRVLEILEGEILSTMALLGVTSVDQIDSSYVCPADAVVPPHEMSAWPNLPRTVAGLDGRIM